MKLFIATLLMSLTTLSYAGIFEENVKAVGNEDGHTVYQSFAWGEGEVNIFIPIVNGVTYMSLVRIDGKKNARIEAKKFCQVETGDLSSKASILSFSHGQQEQYVSNGMGHLKGGALYKFEFSCK